MKTGQNGMTRLGFVGTGTITEAMVTGIKASALRDWPIVLSPRNAEMAAGLAARFTGVTVAPSNQAVVDGADLVVLAVRPQVAEAVVRPLQFRPGQTVLSLIAAVPCARLAAWTGLADVARAVPLPFVERNADVTPVFPAPPVVVELFDALGKALPVPSEPLFDVYCATSALMASYFGIAEAAVGWSVGQGLPDADARAYVASLFGNLGDVLRADPRSLAELRHAHATKGGLNEQVFSQFAAGGGTDLLSAALAKVLDRIQGR